MTDAYASSYSLDGETVHIVTKPCWICGQMSTLRMPKEAWDEFYVKDVHPAQCWPDGTHEQHVLLISGTHLKCWDEEFKIFPEVAQGNQ